AKPRTPNDVPSDPKVNRFALRRWRTYLEETATTKHPTFAPWHKFTALSEKDFAAKAPEILKPFLEDAKAPLNPDLAKLLTAKPLTTLSDAAAAYAQFLESEIANRKSQIANSPNF